MKFDEFEHVSNIIIYFSLSIIISSITFGIHNKHFGLAVLTASLFFISVYLLTNRSFFMVIFIVYILGIFINYNYYNVNSNEINGVVEVVKEDTKNSIVKQNGRKYNINENFEIGDKLYIKGSLKINKDYEKGIIGDIDIINERKINSNFKKKLLYLRENIYIKLKENIGQRKAALISSLAFGYKDKVDDEDIEEMKSLGIIHAISVSGLHIVLIYTIINMVVSKGISLSITSIYVIFTGAEFSSIRSLFMISILVLSKRFYKNYSSLGALALSAMILALIEPYCVFDLGWNLSYGATLGIILFREKINKKLYKLPKYIRENIAISLSAQVFTLPILIRTFNEFSITFLIGNILVIPILNLIIIIGNSLIIGIINMQLFDFISYILLRIIEGYDFIIDKLDFLSNSTIYCSNEFIILYGVLLISYYFIKKGFNKFYTLPIISLFFIMISLYSPFLKINYLKYNGMLVSFEGQRIVMANKINVDMKELKEKNFANEGYRNGEKIKINNRIGLASIGKNFILSIGEKNYILKVNNKIESYSNYDIIDFVEGNISGILIIGDYIFTY
ncbi:MAG: ComEC/Rec2 family competence protein [Clostridiales bacterium]|nr:ComEC/Rec2 family competence protein [Clostridiales bacterium]